MCIGRAIFSLLVLCLSLREAGAISRYHVRLNPQQVSGLMATLSFEFTSSDTSTNTVTILNFTHNGSAQHATWEGGPIFGKLLDGANPADTTTVGDLGFYAQVGIPFDSFASLITFTTDLTETGPLQQRPPDELACFLLRRSDLVPYPTSDDLQADALFAIDITGQAGGDLSVYSPMTFVAPDSLILVGAVVDVPLGSRTPGRLQFRSVGPNPSRGGVRLVYEVPEPGGVLRVKVFDVAGRLLAEPFVGKRNAGTWTTTWNAADAKGRPVPTGLYIVQLQMAGQSLVRRVVLTH